MTLNALEEMIADAMPRERVAVDYTRNRRIVLSLRKRSGVWSFRVHEIFQNAPPDVIRAVVRLYFTRTRRDTRRRLSRLVREYIDQNERQIEALAPGGPRRPTVYGHQGAHYDLKEIFNEVNDEFFDGALDAVLTWSREINRCKLGTWRPLPNGGAGLIRINRLFDDPSVPRYYLRQLVLHEALHGVFSSRRQDGRTIRHGAAFREVERRSPMYEQARRWEKENLRGLYRRRIKERQAES